MPDKDITKSATAGVTKLDKVNYIQWAIDVQLMLEKKGLWPFVTGKQVEPDATATQDAKDRFDRNKAKSCAIILQCLVPRLQPAAMKSREAALLETICLIRHKDNEEVYSFIARVEKVSDDLAGAADDLKPAERNKAYLLINRIGKEYEHQVQAIYQWQTADFTFEKVSKALLAEANCRRLAAESDKAMDSTVNYYMHQKSFKQQPTSPSSQQNASQSSSSKPNSESLVCFNCGGPGHYTRDCTAPKVPRAGQQSRGRGRGRGRAGRRGQRSAQAPPESQISKQAWFANVCSVKVESPDSEWFLDSCASHHVCGNRDMFCEFEELKPLRLELGEGYSSITGRDTIELSVTVNGAVDETKVYKDVVDTYLGDSLLDVSNGSETHSFNPNESSDDSDDDSSSPTPVEAPFIPPAAPLTTQAPSGVTTQPVPIPPFKPRSKVEKAPVPGKSGWIREQVERQSGATAGQWDVYFYLPGQQVKLHSRPEVRSYCENKLNEPYLAADYDWKPSQKPVDTVVQEPSTEQAVVEPQGATDESDNNGTSEDSYETFAVRVYLVEISERNTYEEAIASPQKADKVNTPIVDSDSLSSIQFVTNDVENTKTKHIRIRYHFYRDWFEREYFKLMKVLGKWNAADIFTKWLSGEQIKLLCSSVFGSEY
uniref:CCHC-type domain-containing protein n=1 Tax=Strigamia maritima TaxID=126957 RepID=T1IRD0_STRMM